MKTCDATSSSPRPLGSTGRASTRRWKIHAGSTGRTGSGSSCGPRCRAFMSIPWQPAQLARRSRDRDAALDGSASGHVVYGPGYGYRGEPVIVSEFGGLRVAGSGGWGWLEVSDENAFVGAYGALIDALMGAGPVV